MRKRALLYIGLSIFVLPTMSFADCYLDGQLYPPGTTIAGLVCQADGSWR